jgi:hypothetical protein
MERLLNNLTPKKTKAMRKINIYILTLLSSLLFVTGCDQGFEEINKSKTGATAINPVYLMNNAIIRGSYPQNTLTYELAIVQQMVSPNSGVLAGGNFNQDNRAVTQVVWQRYYREVIKSLLAVIEQTKDNANRGNLYQMARIWRALSFMILTDSYGDIPYKEAGQAYISQNISPKYESQQEIYADILKELEEASAALDATKTIETGDVLYAGDISKWKKLGYSLMLRAAMRHTKVDENKAKEYTLKAVTGGVFQSNADNATVKHNALYINDIGNILNMSEAANYYLAEPFVNFLKNNNDPRLGVIAVRYVGAKSGGEQTTAKASKDPAVQIGMPMGYDNGSIPAVAISKGLASFYDFTQADRTKITKTTAPIYLVTHSQTQLLLAEAVVRGWITGDPAVMFAEGIRGNMKQWTEYDVATGISDAAIEDYIAAHPLEVGKELEQINTQYWVSSYLAGPEAFANFRRSGYPVLTPNPYPGKEITGDFIRRLTYPDTEAAVNLANKTEAVQRQGPDNLETRVWWDKQ